jgi:phage tail-like protein
VVAVDLVEPDLREAPERFAGYLPGIYQEDAFTRRFLRVFDHVLSMVEGHASALTHQFDPTLAGTAMVDVLTSWLLGPELPPLPHAARRTLLREYSALWRRRGTREGLRRLLELMAPGATLSIERDRAFVLGPLAVLGSGVGLASSSTGDSVIEVRIDELPPGIDAHALSMIIGAYKPVGVEHTLRVEGGHDDARVSPAAKD